MVELIKGMHKDRTLTVSDLTCVMPEANGGI